MRVAALTRFKHGMLYELLKDLGWSQKKFSIETGIGYQTINNICNMTIRPNEAQMSQIEIALGKAGKLVDMQRLFPPSYIGFKRALRVVQVADVEPWQLEAFRQHQTRLLEDAQPPLPPEMIDTEDKLAQIMKLLEGTEHGLTDRERDVIHSHTFKDERFDEIAERYKLSRQAIHNAYWAGIAKIRDYFDKAPLPLPSREVIDANSRPLTEEEAQEQLFNAEKWRDNLHGAQPYFW
jgi:predicted DNA-binding protein YlxM (UPF0122 family)